MPATPRGGRAPGRAPGDAGGTRRVVSAVSWPIAAGIGSSIRLLSRALRHRGAVARRVGRRGRGGNSQRCRGLGIVRLAEDRNWACRVVPETAAVRRAARRDEVGAILGRAKRDLAEGARDRAGDLVAFEPPATPRGGRAPGRASGTRGELARCPAPRAGRSRSGSILRSGCPGGTCDVEGRSRAASGVGDAGGTRRYTSAASWPISFGIDPSIWLSWRYLRRRGPFARRVGRRGRGGNSQGRKRRELAEAVRDLAGDLVVREVPASRWVARAPRRTSGTRRELAGYTVS